MVVKYFILLKFGKSVKVVNIKRLFGISEDANRSAAAFDLVLRAQGQKRPKQRIKMQNY